MKRLLHPPPPVRLDHHRHPGVLELLINGHIPGIADEGVDRPLLHVGDPDLDLSLLRLLALLLEEGDEGARALAVADDDDGPLPGFARFAILSLSVTRREVK